MQATNEKVVTMQYTLTDDEGEILDTSAGQEPLSYLHGAGNIVEGLESAIEGKSPGDAFAVSVAPELGYGPYDEELVQQVPRDRFSGIEELEVGMQFQAQSEDVVHVVTVVDLDDDTVTVDANHPLAGQTLNFDIEIVDVRDATPEEISHGHVHHGGGHCC